MKRHTRAGQLDRLATIQTRTAGKDAAGGPVITWADAGTLYGEQFAGTGQRLTEGETSRWSNTLRLRIRYRTDLIPGQTRLVLDAIPYELLAVHEDTMGTRRHWAIAHLQRVEGGRA